MLSNELAGARHVVDILWFVMIVCLIKKFVIVVTSVIGLNLSDVEVWSLRWVNNEHIRDK
jgi:hypothetical protein